MKGKIVRCVYHGVKHIWHCVVFILSPSFLKTLYFNFHYLPFSQAIKLPFILTNIRFVSLKGEVIIQSNKIRTGMIRIGGMGRNNWCQNPVSKLDFMGGRLVFYGKAILSSGIHIRVHKDALLEIGDKIGSASNLNLLCYYHIKLGNSVKLGWDITIMDTDYHPIVDLYSGRPSKIYAPVVIGNNCWIGAKVFIRKGTKLPDNTIVSSCTVLDRKYKIAPNSVLYGFPATVIAEGYQITEESFNSFPPVTKRAY